MDDFDDPIDDLLSEGDSFFEDPKKLAKKSTPKKSSKVVADLFGFDSDSKPATSKEPPPKSDDWLGLGAGSESKQPKDTASDLKTKTADSKLTFEKDDVNSLLGLSAPEPKSAAAKKSSILSDILGEDKQEDKKFSFDDILQSSSIRKKDPVVPSASAEPKNPVQTLTEAAANRQPRRGRRNSPSLIDPLGIFETPKKEDDTRQADTKSKEPPAESIVVSKPPEAPKTSKSAVPNWLGVSESKSGPEPEKPLKEIVAEPKKAQVVSTEKPTQVQKPPIVENVEKPSMLPDHMVESLLTQQKIASSHMELQNASLALQQQESQLMIAVQLKKYEDNLAEMQKKQQEMLLKQDVQFNSLLERQFTKQQVMENNMRLQQERINNHIQLLLSQPSGSALNVPEDQQQKNEYIKNTFEEHRKFYDDIINSLKQKHTEEIFLLEESYKKQITFLENSIVSTETRLKAEIDNINKHYGEKLQEQTTEKDSIIAKYEEKVKQISEQNQSEIEVIKESCKTTVTDIRNEYKLMMEDLSKNKLKETESLLETDMLTKKIDESVGILQVSSQTVHELHAKINDEHKLFADVKSESLNFKEAEIKMMQTALEKQRAANDAERAQLLALVRTLETRVAEQTQAAREERWAFQQATATLAARSAALDRETEFVRRNLDRERDQLKTLRESLLAEHEAIILKVTEEKLAVTAEKSRLETSAKLNQNFDSSKARAEIEAALQIAKEATELTDRERENLCKQQCELEILKRNLHDRELKMKTREQEMEKLFKVADQKYRDGERALSEAKLTEHKYMEQLKEIQKQLVSLAAREKKLTEEKIALSKERLAIHSQIKESKKCGLCEADNYKSEFTQEFRTQNTFPEHEMQWGADAEILRLKYDLENDNVVSKEHSEEENDSET